MKKKHISTSLASKEKQQTCNPQATSPNRSFAQLRSFTFAASKPASSRKVSGAEKEPDLDMACGNGWWIYTFQNWDFVVI
jgi:hypothetical protein